MDPNVELYGGTSRDYLYWLKRQFRGATTRAQIEAVKESLRAREVIGVKEFIIGESDVDLVSKDKLPLKPEDYGVRKIDRTSPQRLDPSADEGRDEILQGHIPI